MRLPRPAVALLPPGAGALALGALFWLLCTPRVLAWLLGDEDFGGEPPWAHVEFHLASWLVPWLRAEPADSSAGLWMPMDPELAGLGALLTTALFALGLAWVLRTVPPTARNWPLTLVACWATAVVAGTVTSGVLAPFRAGEEASAAVAVGWWTGLGVPLVAVFAVPAAAVAVATAVLLRRSAGSSAPPDAAGTSVPPDAAGPAGPRAGGASAAAAAVWRRPGVAAAGVMAATTALALAALGNRWVHDRVLREDAGEEPHWAWGVLRWTMPGVWNDDPQRTLEPVAAGPLLVLAVLQPVLLGVLAWAALRRIPRHTPAALLLTGVCAAVVAAFLVGVGAALLGDGSGDYVRPLIGRLGGSLGYASGAATVGLLGAVAAWLVLRAAGGPPPPRAADEDGGSAPDGPDDAPDGRDGPDGELVVTVTR